MRKIVNLSLPPEMVEDMKLIVKQDEHESLSEFVKEVMGAFIEEKRLMNSIKESEADIKAGRVYEVKSWEDIYKIKP